MQLLCSIQYRIVKESADDAFYELQSPKEQIQAYVFDGNELAIISGDLLLCFVFGLFFFLTMVLFMHDQWLELMFQG